MSELRFVGGMSLIYGVALAVVAGIAAVLLYYRQYRDNGRMATGVVLTVLRVSALALVLLMLTGPVWHREHSVPQRGRVIVLVDESQSMQTGDQQAPPGRKLLAARALGWLPQISERELPEAALLADTFVPADDAAIQAAIKRFDQTTRWQRATAMLTGGKGGLLAELAEHHDVELLGISADRLLSRWSSQETNGRSTPRLPSSSNAPRTNLSLNLESRWRSSEDSSEPAGAKSGTRDRSAVLVLTDGRHNSGPPPIAAARQLAARGVPVYAIGLGSEKPATDLAIVSCEAPLSVFRDDQFRGKVVFQDRMPPGKDFTVRVEHNGQILWERSLATTGAGTQAVEFGFPIRDLVEREVGLESEALRNTVSRSRTGTGLPEQSAPLIR